MKAMKKLALLASASALLLACGTGGDTTAPPPTPAASATATTPPPAPKRTLVDGTQLVAAPTNLLLDPGFGLVGGQQQYGAFFGFLEDYTDLTLDATLDSRSPAAFGGAVALVKTDGATDKSSSPALVLASFQGGAGPFHGQVWVSKSTIDGKPTTFGTDKKTVYGMLTDSSPDGDAFDMTPVDGATKIIGGRTWVLLQVDVTKPLPYGGYFVVHMGGGGGQWQIAAPEVTAQPLLSGQTTMSLRAPAVGRSKTLAERGAITKYEARRSTPRWTPARASRPAR